MGSGVCRRNPGTRPSIGVFVHEPGQGDVQLRDPAGIVGGQRHLHRGIDVEPFRVVIHVLGLGRDPGHEGEGLLEVGEAKLPMEFAVEAQKLLGVSLEGSVG